MEENKDSWKSNLSKRDVELCEIICKSSEPLGFNQIKKHAGIHQEKLSRSLKRLVMYGYILKYDTKYGTCC